LNAIFFFNIIIHKSARTISLLSLKPNKTFTQSQKNIEINLGKKIVSTDSGVHGALVVLEPSFTGDTMATALGIPPAKHMIRRHLTAELEALVLPARYSVYCHPEATLDNAH
jgi:hypothetical protein